MLIRMRRLATANISLRQYQKYLGKYLQHYNNNWFTCLVAYTDKTSFAAFLMCSLLRNLEWTGPEVLIPFFIKNVWKYFFLIFKKSKISLWNTLWKKRHPQNNGRKFSTTNQHNRHMSALILIDYGVDWSKIVAVSFFFNKVNNFFTIKKKSKCTIWDVFSSRHDLNLWYSETDLLKIKESINTLSNL